MEVEGTHRVTSNIPTSRRASATEHQKMNTSPTVVVWSISTQLFTSLLIQLPNVSKNVVAEQEWMDVETPSPRQAPSEPFLLSAWPYSSLAVNPPTLSGLASDRGAPQNGHPSTVLRLRPLRDSPDPMVLFTGRQAKTRTVQGSRTTNF